MTRRELLKRIAAGAVGFGALFTFFFWSRRRSPSLLSPDMKRRGLIRPPGTVPEAEFMGRCIRCQKCSEACEAGAIRLFSDGTALDGTPYLLTEDRACNLCLECGEACPTGAILPLEDKREAKMGVARIDKQLCVSWNGTGICGACHTACPLRNRAIKQGLRNQPEVIEEVCVGCGLCEEACPVYHDKAIRVFSPREWPWN